MVSTLEQMQVPNGTGLCVRGSKRPLLASRTRCNVLWKPPKFGNKVKMNRRMLETSRNVRRYQYRNNRGLKCKKNNP